MSSTQYGQAYQPRQPVPRLLKYKGHNGSSNTGDSSSTTDYPPDDTDASNGSNLIDEDTIPLVVPPGSFRRKKDSLPGWFYVTMLICISCLSFGSYYSYDSVSALESTLKDTLDLDGFKFGLFYALYSFPNIIVVILGGIFIDKFGNKVSAIVLCSLVAAGTLLVALATLIVPVSQKWAFFMMLVGRFIFGVGAESSYVVQNSMCVEWFTGSNLATAIGVTAALSRVGSIAVYEISPPLAAIAGYQWCLWLAFFTTIFSLGAVFGYVYLCKWAEQRLPPAPTEETPSFKSILSFSPLYWISLVICTLIYSTITPFRSQTASEIGEKYNLDEHRSNFVLSLIDITSIVLSPLCGWLVDKTHQRGWIVFGGNLIGVLGFILFATNVSPYAGVIILGFHTTVVPAALYPCIPLLTSPANEGLAYAVMSSLINLVLAGMSPLAGHVLDEFGFFWLAIMLAAISLVACITSLVWNVIDMNAIIPILNEPELLLPKPEKWNEKTEAQIVAEVLSARRKSLPITIPESSAAGSSEGMAASPPTQPYDLSLKDMSGVYNLLVSP